MRPVPLPIPSITISGFAKTIGRETRIFLRNNIDQRGQGIVYRRIARFVNRPGLALIDVGWGDGRCRTLLKHIGARSSCLVVSYVLPRRAGLALIDRSERYE